MEKLLGHSFAIGEESLSTYVDNAINKSIVEHNLKLISINPDEVDWMNIVSRSVNRTPPFEKGEKEKGFRDSIISNSFMKLINDSPKTPNICRLALVSGDRNLKDYISELIGDAKNVRLLSSLEDLESLINTLVSTVTEEFSNEFSKKAAKLFFEKDTEKGYYFKFNIASKIQSTFRNELYETTKPGHHKEIGLWWISPQYL